MNRLYVLINSLKKRSVSNASVTIKGQLKKLEEAILSNTKDEKQIEQGLFPGEKHSGVYYAQLKKRLYNKYINLTLISEEDETSLKKAHSECYKSFSAMQVLLGRFERRAAVVIAENTLPKSLKYMFTPLNVEFAYMLKNHYILIENNPRKLKKYNDIYLEQKEVLEKERVAEDLLCLVRSKNPGIQKTKITNEHLNELKEWIGIKSFRFNFLAWSTIISYHHNENELLKVIEIAEEAINFFIKNTQIYPENVLFGFYFRKLDPQLKLKQFSAFKETTNQIFQLSKKGDYNTTIVDTYIIIAQFYQEEFDSAILNLKDIKHRAYKFPELKEMWQVLDAYAHFFSKKNNFRLRRFLNDTPIFSKDKRGMNVNIIIIQILFFLKRKKYGQIIDRMEPLSAYSYNYLRKGETFRSNCFIKMLLIVPKCSFNRVAVERKTKDLLDKLYSHPITSSKQNVFDEPVPFEVIWERVISLLK